MRAPHAAAAAAGADKLVDATRIDASMAELAEERDAVKALGLLGS